MSPHSPNQENSAAVDGIHFLRDLRVDHSLNVNAVIVTRAKGTALTKVPRLMTTNELQSYTQATANTFILDIGAMTLQFVMF